MTRRELGKTSSKLDFSVSDDTELFSRWCAGDTAAGDALARCFHRSTRAYFARRFPNDAEDLAQRTWVAIAEARARYRGDCGFAGFFAGVARNICRAEIRRRHRAQVLLDSLSTVPAMSCDPTHDIELAEDVQRLMQALQTLPCGLFDTVHRYYFERTSARRVGEGLGVPEANVRSRLHRARALLRKGFDPAARRATGSGGGEPAGVSAHEPRASARQGSCRERLRSA